MAAMAGAHSARPHRQLASVPTARWKIGYLHTFESKPNRAQTRVRSNTSRQIRDLLSSVESRSSPESGVRQKDCARKGQRPSELAGRQ